MSAGRALTCPMCGSEPLQPAFRYDAPPPGETHFQLGEGQSYGREYRRCPRCGHFIGVHDLDLAGLYEGEYMDSTYSGERLRETFEQIMGLPPERSDNLQRVDRIQRFWSDRRGESSGTLLDVGSGLGVFPARMKETGWSCTAIDPDPRSVHHSAEVVGVEAVQADFNAADDLGRFDLITFNKVLEHIDDPVAMLARAHAFQADHGIVYVEVPDGEGAAADGPEREEFFVEHVHVFSAASLALLCARAGFALQALERVREPSTKYTLVAFLQ
jgi:SAM-dependent methyltransferase